MTEKHNATCKICGKSYYACTSCADSIKLHPYKIFTDTAEHFKVFQAVRGFSTGVYTKEEFKSKLQNIDLSDLENYREHIKMLIKDVLKEEKVEEPIIVESVIETESAIIEEIKEVKKVEEEVSAVSMAATSRKKKFKVEVE